VKGEVGVEVHWRCPFGDDEFGIDLRGGRVSVGCVMVSCLVVLL
jgi:hypothetical protein